MPVAMEIRLCVCFFIF